MERKLTAILSADVKGYSRLMGEDEEATIRTLTTYREAMSALIRQHHGRVVDSPGDNLLAEFASAVDAMQCTVDIQQDLRVRNTELPDHRKMEFRIGLNVGDVVVEGEKIYGDGVNIAARLESLAEPGGICVSGTVYDQIENKLTLGYEYLGEQTVKNIAKPVRVWRVRDGLGAAISLSGRVQAPTLALPDKPSIAVLPFTNMSGDLEQEYFSDGITEDLITDLSKISGLFVISRNSVFLYKGKAVKPEQVSRDLGVRYMLEGSVRKAGNRVRITAQLIEATTGYHLWAERYDRELHDIFSLQDEVTQKIVAVLEVKLTGGERERLGRPPTDNLEAYDAFLRGESALWHFTKESHAQARRMFERALELDPQYATAYADLGWTYLVEFALQWSQDPQTLERAFALAQKAIALDEALSQAHIISGVVYLWQKQHAQAIAEGERAIALAPNSAEGYAWLANILNFAGKPEEAQGLAEQAMRLNPQYPGPWHLFEIGHAAYLMGRYEEASVALKRALTRDPEFWPAHLHLAVSLSESGQEEEAWVEATEVLRLSPKFSLEAMRQALPYKDKIVLERALAALHKVGLK
jgi:adenylate cyclase